MVAVRAIFNSFRSAAVLTRRLPFLSDNLQQLLHFRSSPNRDAREAAAHVLASVAKQNAFLLQLANQSRSSGAKIYQDKVSRARITLDAQPAQFLGDP